MLAHTEGWYNQRQVVQLAFIILVAIICVVAALVLLSWARNAPAPTWIAVIGTTFVLGFVLMRAASFHHMDRFLGERILGFRWNWILEMGGISLVLVGSKWRRKRDHAAGIMPDGIAHVQRGFICNHNNSEGSGEIWRNSYEKAKCAWCYRRSCGDVCCSCLAPLVASANAILNRR